jgi:O-antigen/teichoic acid export membrane protein
MRTKKTLLNSITSLLKQLVMVVCGFILPRFMLGAFGSEINGAVSSITQFLGYITLMEAGVGGVTRAALYKPLADGDCKKISGIANATQSFFRKLATIFLIYVAVLSVVFKYISNTDLSALFTGTLVLIIAISTFAEYYFGITNSLILQADQRTYITNTIQIGTIILNTIISVILIKLGCGIHIVKFGSVAVYILRPVFLNMIVRKLYHIDRSEPMNNEALRQRWNGLGQHIAFFVHNNTDSMVVTIFLGLKWVSVYSVYYMVCNGIRNIVNALTGGSEAAFGNMIAKNEIKVLNSRFQMLETLGSCVITVFFTATGLLLLDFIGIYTNGITDIDYQIPLFGTLLVISEGIHCIKQLYHSLVLAAGHYKETQRGAFIEAGLNVILSVVLVNVVGISGIIIATIVSTIYRMLDYVWYLQKYILERNIVVFIRRILTTILCAASVVIICYFIPFHTVTTYTQWLLKAIPIFVISCTVTFLWNIVLYKKDLLLVVHILRDSIFKRK